MSLPLPSIGFFAPLPLPMMIPFMGIQSAVMAEQFGTMFQYGKRRISAMSNEEFNALTPTILQERMTKQIQEMIPEMEKQIQAMGPLMEIILREFGSYISRAYELIVHEGRHALGTIDPHGTGTVTPTPETTSQCPAGSHWDATRGTCVPDDTTSIHVHSHDLSPVHGTLEQRKAIQGGFIEDAILAVKAFLIQYPSGTTNTQYGVQDYQNKLTGLLSSVTSNHNYYKELFGEWYVPTNQI